MTKKLLVHPNERLDRSDFNRAAYEFTQETIDTHRNLVLLDRRSRILEGFRVEIADQTANPGLVTVYNGSGFARDGSLLHDDDQSNSSLSITLAGANQTFYLEAIVTETPSDADARAFWDPTTVNVGTGVPTGSEVGMSVPTRTVVTWSIVTPVSTVGFESTTNPNSVKVPLAILRTDASNQINVTQNTTLTQVAAATVLETDYAVGVGSIRVLDSRLFPDNGTTMTIDVGGTNPEVVTITTNDRDNGIIAFTPNTVYAHSAGAIVRLGGTGYLVKENTDPSATSLSAAPPNHAVDQTRRFWSGDELRGSALSQDKETFGKRGDLNVRSLKDFVDFFSAQLHELKFGNLRPDITSTAPPTSFSTKPRYFDKAGSVTGARTAYVTIGDGVNTFGDINGTTQAAFIAAQAALPSAGGTIYIKPGTYVFSSSVTLTKCINFVGDNKNSVYIQNNSANAMFSAANQVLSFKDISLLQGSGNINSLSVDNCTVYFDITTCAGISLVNSGSTLVADNSLFLGTFSSTSNQAISGRISKCDFGPNFSITTPIFDLTFIDCTTSGSITGTFYTAATGTYTRAKFINCTISKDNTNPATPVFSFGLLSFCLSLTFEGCEISADSDSTAGSIDAIIAASTAFMTELKVNNSKLWINNAGGSASNLAVLCNLGAILKLSVDNSEIYTNSGGYTRAIQISGNSDSQATYRINNSTLNGHACVYVENSDGTLTITGSTLKALASHPASYYSGVKLDVTSAPNTIISDCIFDNRSVGNSGTSRYGVQLNTTAKFLSVKGCKFLGFNSATATNVSPIYVNNMNSIDLVVEGNSIDTVTGAGTVYGIYVNPSPTATGNSYVHINNNTIRSVTSTALQEVQGISVNSITAGSIKDNTIYNVTTNSATLHARGIYANGVADCVISGNKIHSVVAASTYAYGLDVDGCSITNVSNNVIHTVSSTSVESAQIRINTCNDVNVSGNMLFNEAAAVIAASYGIKITHSFPQLRLSVNNNNIMGTNIAYCIFADLPTFKNVKINDNDLYLGDGSGTGYPTGIELRYHGESFLVNIEKNNITLPTNSVSTGYGIRVISWGGDYNIYGITVNGNIIGSSVSSSAGISTTPIQLYVGAFSVSVCGNTIAFPSSSAHDRNAIAILGVTSSSIRTLACTGNTVRWNSTTDLIKLTRCAGGTVSANSIAPFGSAPVGIYSIAAKAADANTQIMVVGNTITDTVSNGAIIADGTGSAAVNNV